MEILQKGNVVKSKTSDTLMVITKIRISKQEFNKNALGYILDDKEIDESKNYIYICYVEENGVPKKLEFKRDELIFVRASY